MWHFVSECVNQLQTPFASDILRTIQENNICAGTQCFETLPDAGFGNEVPISATNENGFYITLTIFMLMAIALRPRVAAAKPQTLMVNSTQEPCD
jgi:hypothetical protein